MKDIFFYAFDLINNDTYHQRVISLESFVAGSKYTKVVPWHMAKDEAKVKFYHDKFIAEGYEGTMIRNTKSLYQPNKRSYDLLKLKNFLEEEFEVIGWSVGKGKFSNIPTFKLITKENKIFEAVPKGSEEIRLEYLQKADSYIGTKSTVRFFEYTADKIPRFPIISQMNRFDID
jgi:ATP-dependent DNA ligase